MNLTLLILWWSLCVPPSWHGQSLSTGPKLERTLSSCLTQGCLHAAWWFHQFSFPTSSFQNCWLLWPRVGVEKNGDLHLQNCFASFGIMFIVLPSIIRNLIIGMYVRISLLVVGCIIDTWLELFLTLLCLVYDLWASLHDCGSLGLSTTLSMLPAGFSVSLLITHLIQNVEMTCLCSPCRALLEVTMVVLSGE